MAQRTRDNKSTFLLKEEKTCKLGSDQKKTPPSSLMSREAFLDLQVQFVFVCLPVPGTLYNLGQARLGLKKMKEKKNIHTFFLLAKETMGKITLDIRKLNTQSIKFGNKKKMKLSEA